MPEITDFISSLDFSIVVPAFNEGSDSRHDPFCQNLEGLMKAAAQTGAKHEILVVDDGSTDSTASVAESMGITVIKHSDGLQHGKGAAVKLGLLTSRGDIGVFTDADGAILPQTVIELIDSVHENDVDIAVIRRNVNGHGSFSRKLGHFAMEWLCNHLAPTDVKDTQAGAKAFRRRTIELIMGAATTEGYAFDRHVLHIAHVIGLHVDEIMAEIHPVGDSHLRLFNDSFRMLLDSYRIGRDTAKHFSQA